MRIRHLYAVAATAAIAAVAVSQAATAQNSHRQPQPSACRDWSGRPCSGGTG